MPPTLLDDTERTTQSKCKSCRTNTKIHGLTESRIAKEMMLESLLLLELTGEIMTNGLRVIRVSGVLCLPLFCFAHAETTYASSQGKQFVSRDAEVAGAKIHYTT